MVVSFLGLFGKNLFRPIFLASGCCLLLQTSSHHFPSVHLSVSKFLLFIRHQSYWIRGSTNELIFNLIASMKTLSPSKYTFRGTEDQDFHMSILWVTQFSPHGIPHFCSHPIAEAQSRSTPNCKRSREMQFLSGQPYAQLKWRRQKVTAKQFLRTSHCPHGPLFCRAVTRFVLVTTHFLH